MRPSMPQPSKNLSTDSSVSRPLNLNLRADITFHRQQYQGRDYWLAKDPVSLKYFRFEEEEYRLLQLMDGSNSPEEIKLQFDYEFAPQKISMQELYQFIGMLYRNCLLISQMPGQGVELRHRGRDKQKRESRSTITNVLAIRFKGFDPDWILTEMIQWTWWIFSWPFFFCVLLLWGAAASLIFTQFEYFAQKLPAFEEFFAAGNWIWLAAVMAATKIAHEFGHGLACKRFGGQCHEMGVMLLVLTPCLYCNVSDSWTLPSKWKRALIAAAGMYVELILAAIATFVWWFSNPGLVNQLALNVVFVSSVSTILFNGNPLLRYDGYYILADILEIPNLRQKASSILQRFAAQWVLGIESRPDPFLPARRKWFFALYSVAAVVYRWFITLTIFWFLYALLEPYGVKIIGQAIALLAIWGLLGMPLVQAFRFFSVPGRFGTVKRHRVVISSLVMAAILYAVLLIPIPHYVRCPFIVQARHAENVYVDLPGTMQSLLVEHGAHVEPGAILLTLENDELDSQIVTLQGKVALQQARFENLKLASHSSLNQRASVGELEVARVALETAKADLKQRAEDLKRLNVVATQAGYVIPPPEVPQEDLESGDLRDWDGYPLERRNLGCFLKPTTLVAKIVPDLNQLEAVLTVDQSDIEYVENGQVVELLPYTMPWKSFLAETQSIAITKMKSVPKGLSSQFGGDLVTTRDDNGVTVPHSATFQISVPFEIENRLIVDGSTGKAKILAGSQTIGQRFWRLAQKTFRFDL